MKPGWTDCNSKLDLGYLMDTEGGNNTGLYGVKGNEGTLEKWGKIQILVWGGPS